MGAYPCLSSKSSIFPCFLRDDMLIHLWEFVVRLSPHFCPRVASELRFWLLHIAECRWKFDQEVVFVSTYIYIYISMSNMRYQKMFWCILTKNPKMRNTATVFFLVADSDTFFSYGIHGGLFLDLSIAHDSRKSIGSLELLVIQQSIPAISVDWKKVVRWRLQLGSGFSVCGVLFTTKKMDISWVIYKTW